MKGLKIFIALLVVAGGSCKKISSNGSSQTITQPTGKDTAATNDAGDATPATNPVANNPTVVGTLTSVPAETTIYVVSQSSTLVPDGIYYKCDGTDDQIEIQTALTDIKNAGGGTVALSDGVFNMNNNIYLYGNTIFTGAGIDTSTLYLIDSAAPFAKAGMIRALSEVNISVTQMTLDGNNAGQINDSSHSYGRFGVYYEACTGAVIDYVKVINFHGYGIDPHGTGGTTIFTQNLQVTNCIAMNNGWDGITIDKSTDVVVANNVASNNGRHGINIVTGSYNVVVRDNQIDGNGYFYYTGASGCGIYVQNNQGYGTHDVTLQNNIINNSKKGGICLQDVYNIPITNNQITNTQICLRVNTISSLSSNNIVITSTSCTGTVNLKTDTPPYTGPYPTFIGSADPLNTGTRSPTPTPPTSPDPTCSAGIFYARRNICCSFSCGACGGSNCGSNSGGAAGCCATNIEASGISCNSNPPPCIVSVPAYSSVYVAAAGSTGTAPEGSFTYTCDGVDDHVELQSAVGNVAAAGGGTVYLSAGTFVLNTNLNLTSNMVLLGQGIDVTVIKLRDNAAPFKYGSKSAAGFVRGVSINDITVRALTIDGNKANQGDYPVTDDRHYGKYGFYCETCNDVLLDTIRVNDHLGYGFDPHGAPGAYVYSEGLTIVDSIAENNDWDGITIDKTRDTLIQNCIARNNGRHGINIVTGSLNTLITGNTVSGNGFTYYKNTSGCGIMVQDNGNFGTGLTTVNQNTISNSKSAGIYFTSVYQSTATSNAITGSGNCMSVYNTVDTTLDSNMCNTPAKKIVISGVNNNLVLINQPYTRLA